MLPSQHRLRRRADFARVYAKGKSYATSLAVVYVLPCSGNALRVGFSVSGKLGKSTVRNRVRRRMREATRALLPSLQPGYDVVVTARRRAVEATYYDFLEALRALFQKAGLSVEQH